MQKSIFLASAFFFFNLLVTAQGDSLLSSKGTFTDDRDMQVYNYIQIGSQTWMAENLNYATFSGSWCYDHEASNCGLYGRLYDWYTAMDACPFGWHLPIQEEWSVLSETLGGDAVAGGFLKETGTKHWNKPNKGATNDSGFTALPGGYRSASGDYASLGYYVYFWSASEKSRTDAWRYSLYSGSDGLDRSFSKKNNGCSVRCIKDQNVE